MNETRYETPQEAEAAFQEGDAASSPDKVEAALSAVIETTKGAR